MRCVSKDGCKLRTRGHPSRRPPARAPQEEVGERVSVAPDWSDRFPLMVEAAQRNRNAADPGSNSRFRIYSSRRREPCGDPYRSRKSAIPVGAERHRNQYLEC